MNRLSALATPPKRSTPAVARVQRPLLRPSASQQSPHCLLAPLHYERNYAYPLIVWLHGPGGDERELTRIMPLVSLRNYASVAVRGPSQQRRGFDWPQSSNAILDAELRIADAVALAKQRFNLHPQRVFLAGYGSGGTMAMRIALRCCERYAGAASLNGPFPEGHSPLARLALSRSSRFLIAHCRDSLTYPINRVCRELSLFHAAGMAVTLRQYPCGDELTTQMLHDMDVWLMEQVTGVVCSAEHQPAQLPSDWN